MSVGGKHTPLSEHRCDDCVHCVRADVVTGLGRILFDARYCDDERTDHYKHVFFTGHTSCEFYERRDDD